MADPEKSEKPTQRRLQKAREEGNFASSRQFVAGFNFIAFVALLQFLGDRWLRVMTSTMAWLFHEAFVHELTLNQWMAVLERMVYFCGLPIIGVGVILLILNLAVQLGLTRMGFSFQKLAPDFKRLNPASRLKQVYQHNTQAFFQALVMLPVCGYVVYFIVSHNMQLLSLPLKSLGAAEEDVFGSFHSLLWRAAALFFVFGCVDLFRENKKFIDQMKMSKHDIKDEHKEAQGSPQMKMRIRRLQRDAARKRMMHEVPTATAVIVNPTHFAVALRYDPESMVAPVVVAKGKNYLALRIKQKALDHGVPLVENPPLAQGLYKAVDVGQEIPPDLYKAVAEILAYIFRLAQRR